MPRPEKGETISDQVILHLLDQGLSQAEIGRKLNTTRQNIYGRMRKFGHATARNAVVEHGAEIVEREIDFGNQLLKAAKAADELLDKLTGKVDKESRELSIRAMSEIRQQVQTWNSIRKDLFTMKTMVEVYDEILDVIGSVDEDVRSEILRRLRKKGLLRGIFPQG